MKSDTQRVVITIALCMAILVVYTKFFAPSTPPPAPPAPATGAAGAPAAAPAPGAAGAPAPSAPGAAGAPAPSAAKPGDPTVETPAAPAAPKVAEREDVLETPELKVVLTNHGGALRSFVLKEKQFEQREGGTVKPLELVTTAPPHLPLASSFPGNGLDLPERMEFQVAQASPKEVLYVWESERARVEKRVALGTTRYLLDVEVKVKNKSDKEVPLPSVLSFFGRVAPGSGEGGFMKPPPNVWTALCHSEGKLHELPLDALGEGPKAFANEVRWVGAADRYFLLGGIPAAVGPRQCKGEIVDGAQGIFASRLITDGKLAPGAELGAQYGLYGGPKFVRALDAVQVGGRDPMLGDAVNYGWLGPISRALLELMLFFYRVFSNWGVAIILLTVVVKVITLPFTQKSMVSMKKMASLKPEIESLKKRFGEDKQRLNQEMMALYKQKGINPLGGCLPMLIQMPVWFALYSTLGNAVELYQSHFLWMRDLTKADPYFIIPVVMGACMFIQQKTAPQPADSEQQKMLMYAMPVMFTFFSLFFPAGLTVYILTNTLLTMGHQFWMNRHEPRAKKPAKAKS